MYVNISYYVDKITLATSCLILPLVFSLMLGKQTAPRCPPNNQGSPVLRQLIPWKPAEINAALSILEPTVNQANELCGETPPEATFFFGTEQKYFLATCHRQANTFSSLDS